MPARFEMCHAETTRINTMTAQSKTKVLLCTQVSTQTVANEIYQVLCVVSHLLHSIPNSQIWQVAAMIFAREHSSLDSIISMDDMTNYHPLANQNTSPTGSSSCVQPPRGSNKDHQEPEESTTHSVSSIADISAEARQGRGDPN